jgi:8-oxo-dGTP diphosphatase
MVRFGRAPSCHRVGVASLLRPADSFGLVPAVPVFAGSPARLPAMETSNRLRKTPPAPGNAVARCLAVWQLAARLVNPQVKHSVAVLVREGDRILAIRRPDEDDELPGIWGLPAGSFRNGETLDDLIHRIGRDKLGVQLTPARKLAAGSQQRARYRLEMELWEATIEGTPGGTHWQWTMLETLAAGSEQGSLCCRLALSGGGGLHRQ